MECISIKTDYSLLKSTIKIPELILYAKNQGYKSLGIIDDTLSSSIEFIKESLKNDIKPLIGLHTKLKNYDIFIYARNNKGLKHLFKLQTYLLDNELTTIELSSYIMSVVIVIPYKSVDLYEELTKLSAEVFIGYENINEKNSALLITFKVVSFTMVLSIEQTDTKYLNYSHMINENSSISTYTNIDYSSHYLYDQENASSISELINITLEKNTNLIPHYDKNIVNSYTFLESLAIKGLSKRLNGNISDEYKNRLLYELKIIKQMGYVDYFLIVYDYVKFAIKNDI